MIQIPAPQQRRPPKQDAHLRDLWNFTRRNRWLAIGIPVVMALATAVFVTLATPIYDAAVWIRIDEERTSLPVLDALSDVSQGSQLATEMQVLRRRPLAEAVIDSLALQVVLTRPRGATRSAIFADVQVARSAPEAAYRFRQAADGRFTVHRVDDDRDMGSYAPGERVALDGATVVLAAGAAAHEQVRIDIQSFRETLKSFERAIVAARPDREANIVVVGYEGTDPVLVREVPNTMARLFIAQRQRVRKTEAYSTVDFLVVRLDSMEFDLRYAEDELRVFRERENIVSLEHEGRASIERLARLQGERDLLDAERSALAELLAEVQAQARTEAGGTGPSPYRRLIAFPTLLRNFAVSELFRSLAEVENERAELLNRRTEADPDVLVLTGRMEELEEQLRTIAVTYLEGLGNQVSSLESNLALFQTELLRVPAKEVQFARLQRHAEVLDEIFELLQTRLQEAQIAAAVDDPTVRVVEPAALPIEPIRPNKRLSVLMALLVGLTLGYGIAFVRENMDGTVHTREELQDVIGAVPVLGTIPRIREAAGSRFPWPAPTPSGNGRRMEVRLVTGRDPRSPVSEAYRSLRTNIAFSRMERAPTTLVFTSPTPGDGKSTSAANLAVTLAQQGLRCLLVDADLRRGFLNDVVGARREPGLSNVLLSRTPWEDAIQQVKLGDSASLDFLGTGTLPPNPAELLAAPRMHTLLDQLAAAYDTVILDTPPLTLVTDAAILGTHADGVILVVRAAATDRGAISYALEQLVAVRAPVLGAVLNDVDQKREQYYGSYSAGVHASYYGVPAGR